MKRYLQWMSASAAGVSIVGAAVLALPAVQARVAPGSPEPVAQ